MPNFVLKNADLIQNYADLTFKEVDLVFFYPDFYLPKPNLHQKNRPSSKIHPNFQPQITLKFSEIRLKKSEIDPKFT